MPRQKCVATEQHHLHLYTMLPSTLPCLAQAVAPAAGAAQEGHK